VNFTYSRSPKWHYKLTDKLIVSRENECPDVKEVIWTKYTEFETTQEKGTEG
jgi:hypothetical protein